MIGRLVGTIVSEEPTGGLVIDVGGVGYELACPIGTVGRAATETDAPQEHPRVVLHVHTNLRQDALELFGFSGLEERAAFRQLINVPNVGPKLAIAVLNILPADELAEVIDREDKVRLSKVPGVGKKTAERLVLELRGKLPRLGSSTGGAGAGGNAPAGDLDNRLVAALTGLGYRQTEAEKAAAHLVGGDAPQDLSSLLREALKYLAS
jgi:Holliday junction DNA helicase RuvA